MGSFLYDVRIKKDDGFDRVSIIIDELVERTRRTKTKEHRQCCGFLFNRNENN